MFLCALQFILESLSFRLPVPTPNPKPGRPPIYNIADGADITFARIVTTGILYHVCLRQLKIFSVLSNYLIFLFL